jgi:hypothetical protein
MLSQLRLASLDLKNKHNHFAIAIDLARKAGQDILVERIERLSRKSDLDWRRIVNDMQSGCHREMLWNRFKSFSSVGLICLGIGVIYWKVWK